LVNEEERQNHQYFWRESERQNGKRDVFLQLELEPSQGVGRGNAYYQREKDSRDADDQIVEKEV
jgi:hypothetical protein